MSEGRNREGLKEYVLSANELEPKRKDAKRAYQSDVDCLKDFCHWKRLDNDLSDDDLEFVRAIENLISQVGTWKAKYERSLNNPSSKNAEDSLNQSVGPLTPGVYEYGFLSDGTLWARRSFYSNPDNAHKKWIKIHGKFGEKFFVFGTCEDDLTIYPARP